MQSYNAGARRSYIKANLRRYDDNGFSYRNIRDDVVAAFGLESLSHATIVTDIKKIRESLDRQGAVDAAAALDPENFPAWRARYFALPGGSPYETPEHQFALFWMIVAIAMKRKPPQWVLDYFKFGPEVADDIVSLTKLLTFILLVAPRMGKTELVLHANIWLIIHNPNIRIIYCQGIGKTSARMMGYVQFELEHNELLVKDYGPFKDEKYRWNTEEFTVGTRTAALKAPTFTPIGITTNIRSLDADIIEIDDPQDERRVQSETVVEGDYYWYLTELATRREAHTPILGVGSHLPLVFGDLWGQIEESADDLAGEGQMVYVRKIPAHDREKCLGEPHIACVLWPSVRPWHFLQAMKALLDQKAEGLFDVVYNQDPRAAGLSIFDPDVLKTGYIQPRPDDSGRNRIPLRPEGTIYGILDAERRWKQWPKCCGEIISALGFDPASGETRDAAESALTIRAACVRCGRRFTVDYWHRRQSPERHPDTIADYVRAYRKDGLARVRIEINSYQKSLAREPRLEEHARQLRFLIGEWLTDDRKNSPQLGIPLLFQWMKQGMHSVPAMSKMDLAYGEAYIKSYRRYPRKPTDIVMSDWLAELDLLEQLEAMQFYTPENTDDYDDMPPYLEDEVYEVDLQDLWSEDWNEEDTVAVVA